MRVALLFASAATAAADFLFVSGSISPTCGSSAYQSASAGGCFQTSSTTYASIACANSTYYSTNTYSSASCTGTTLATTGAHVPFPSNCSLVRGAASLYEVGACRAGNITNVSYPTSGGFIGLTRAGTSCNGPILGGLIQSFYGCQNGVTGSALVSCNASSVIVEQFNAPGCTAGSLNSTTVHPLECTRDSSGYSSMNYTCYSGATQSQSYSPTQSHTPTDTQTASASRSGSASETHSPTHSQTSTFSPSHSPSSSQTVSVGSSSLRTNSLTPTLTQSASRTPSPPTTLSSTGSVSESQSPSPTQAISPGSSTSGTGTSVATPTGTPSQGASASPAAPSASQASTPSQTPTPSQTSSAGSSLSQTPSTSMSSSPGSPPSFSNSRTESNTPSQSSSPGSSVSPSSTTSATPSISVSTRPTPPSTCADGIRDNGETDVDCGGPCAPCAEGRACLGDADCDQAGSTISGTVYNPGTTMVVCSSSTNLCTDLRIGVQAYSDVTAQPGAVSFNLTIIGLPPALFSPAALNASRVAMSVVLDSNLYAGITPSDLVITSVVSVTVSPGRRALGAVASNATGSSFLTIWLLLQPSYGISQRLAVSTINSAPVPSLLSNAVRDAVAPYAPVAPSVSVPAAFPVPLYPPISSTNGNSPATPSPPGRPYSVGGLVVGIILIAIFLALLFVVVYTRATGGRPPFGLGACEGAIISLATCCGRVPLRKRRPTSAGPGTLRQVKSWKDSSQAAPGPAGPQPAAGGGATVNPVQSSLSLRSINIGGDK